MDIDEKKEIAELILGISEPKDRISTLQLALESAKFHLGVKDDEVPNDIMFNMRHNYLEQIINDTPIVKCSDESELFTALFLYLNILEQIGTLFCDKKKDNGITIAIKTFAHNQKYSNSEVQAIKNLRNSLAHNFGLVNNAPSTHKPTLKYIINLGKESEKAVKMPTNKWDGIYADKSEETSCNIYVFPLIKLVNQIINEAITRYNNHTLSFAIENLEEIKARFTIKVNQKQ